MERREWEAAEEQQSVAEAWQRAQSRRQEEEDVKPTPEQLQEGYAATNRQQSEAGAAEKFIQEIMAIRGETEYDVLKDVTPITIETIDAKLSLREPVTTIERGNVRTAIPLAYRL